MTTRIPYTKPSITNLEVAYAADAVANGWGERCYDYIDRFEGALASHLSVKHVIATASCTGALHMGLAAVGVGPGDEVILADTNWVATLAPILYLGATPVIVDILEDSWCLNPALVENAITPKTKAIIATHLYGNLCDMDRLLEIGSKYGVGVIEDAAEAIGSVYRGKQAGSMGLFGTFSFHGTKTITTGEGGAFVTNDSALYERVLTLSNHGRSQGQARQFWPDEIGFKYKMSNVQAAIGCAQLERVNDLVARKRAILAAYRTALAHLPNVVLNQSSPGTESGAWMPSVVFSQTSGVTREDLLAAFSKEGIDARVFFWPLSELGLFETHAATPKAHSIPARAINLPSFHDLTAEQIHRVCSVVEGLAPKTSRLPGGQI